MNQNISELCGGGRHESQIEGLKEKIESKDIKLFSYTGTDFALLAEKANDKVKIQATGGGKYNRRDGSYFVIKYETDDKSIFEKLQEVIEKEKVSLNNGLCLTIDGLPAGIGDTINVEYASDEKIYKHSNQSITITPTAIQSFYEIFHEFVKKYGYDFSSNGSNVKLFDDADHDYVQGTWKGKHFGSDIEVTFEDNVVTIKVDGKITDEKVEYIIIDGSIRKKQVKEDSSKNNYEEFEGVQSFSKKNWFTITAHFYNGASSSCDLMNFEKEKTKEEQ